MYSYLSRVFLRTDLFCIYESNMSVSGLLFLSLTSFNSRKTLKECPLLHKWLIFARLFKRVFEIFFIQFSSLQLGIWVPHHMYGISMRYKKTPKLKKKLGKGISNTPSLIMYLVMLSSLVAG